MRKTEDILSKVKVKDFSLFGVFTNGALLYSGNMGECMAVAESYAVTTSENVYRIGSINTDGLMASLGEPVMSYFNNGDTVFVVSELSR